MTATPGLPREWAAWLALAAGLSPVLVDLARNVASHPHDHCTLLAPVLLALALPGQLTPHPPRRRLGLALLALAGAAQLVGVAVDTWSIARLALPLGALGVGAWLGRPRLMALALLFWVVPIPDTLATLPSPAWESRLAGLGAAVARLVDGAATADGPLIRVTGHSLELTAVDWGYPAAFALSAVGWFAAVRLGRSPVTGALWAAAGGLAGCLIQLPGVLVASLWEAFGDPGGLARPFVADGLWLLAGGGATLAVLRRSRPDRQEGPGEAHPTA